MDNLTASAFIDTIARLVRTDARTARNVSIMPKATE